MFDSASTNRFIDTLPTGVKRVIESLNGREPWVIHETDDIKDMLESIGHRMHSHSNLEMLNELNVEELSLLFVSLTLERYLASLSKLSEFEQYGPLIQRIHNELSDQSAEAETGNRQRLLIARLNTLIRFRVIQRAFSPERLERIKSLIEV